MHEDGTILPTGDEPVVVVVTCDARDRGGVALENNNAVIGRYGRRCGPSYKE